jgi:hypothetical protein
MLRDERVDVGGPDCGERASGSNIGGPRRAHWSPRPPLPDLLRQI